MITGEQIKLTRESIKESQDAFGRRFGVDQATISRWEAFGPPHRGPARMAIERVLSDLEQASAA